MEDNKLRTDWKPELARDITAYTTVDACPALVEVLVEEEPHYSIESNIDPFKIVKRMYDDFSYETKLELFKYIKNDLAIRDEYGK